MLLINNCFEVVCQMHSCGERSVKIEKQFIMKITTMPKIYINLFPSTYSKSCSPTYVLTSDPNFLPPNEPLSLPLCQYARYSLTLSQPNQKPSKISENFPLTVGNFVVKFFIIFWSDLAKCQA